MSREPISAFVLARDEEDRIDRCLRSVAWAEERIVVVDDRTVDATARRAAPLANRVIVRPWEGFAAARRFAIEQTRHPWIFWIDADETADEELARSILEAVDSTAPHAGYRVRRRNRYLGRTILHGAWRNDSAVRLFRREAARIEEREVHEEIAVDGGVGLLPGHLEHDSYRDIAHHIEKIGVWSRLWTKQALREGRRAGWIDLVARPPLRFLKGYVAKAGFLDGRAGLVLAFMDAVYVGMKYASLIEARKASSPRDGAREER